MDHDDSQWDVVFLGDMFYDRDFTIKVADWLKHLRTRHKCCILIGDPDRVYLKDHPLRRNLKRISEIELPSNCIEENRGHSMGYVWEFVQQTWRQMINPFKFFPSYQSGTWYSTEASCSKTILSIHLRLCLNVGQLGQLGLVITPQILIVWLLLTMNSVWLVG